LEAAAWGFDAPTRPPSTLLGAMSSGLEEFGIVDDEASTPAPEPSEPPAGEGISEVDLPAVLSQVPLFAGLLPAHLRRMGGVTKVFEIQKNDLVFRHGDPGDGLYVVKSGAIRISRN